jgi:hypothetical protein
MADKKISALTSATTPLAGTEVLPIVQSGATVKVAVSDLTAGRAISATQLTLTTGNLIVASGQGIDFSATPGTGTTELLADYEEGTWTPIDSSGAGLVFTGASGKYTKIGNLVNARCNFTFPATADTSSISIGGLPFSTSASLPDRQAFISNNTYNSGADTCHPALSATTFTFKTNGNVSRINANYSGAALYVTCVYGV